MFIGHNAFQLGLSFIIYIGTWNEIYDNVLLGRMLIELVSNFSPFVPHNCSSFFSFLFCFTWYKWFVVLSWFLNVIFLYAFMLIEQ